jgi:hypothetical protein
LFVWKKYWIRIVSKLLKKEKVMIKILLYCVWIKSILKLHWSKALGAHIGHHRQEKETDFKIEKHIQGCVRSDSEKE